MHLEFQCRMPAHLLAEERLVTPTFFTTTHPSHKVAHTSSKHQCWLLWVEERDQQVATEEKGETKIKDTSYFHWISIVVFPLQGQRIRTLQGKTQKDRQIMSLKNSSKIYLNLQQLPLFLSVLWYFNLSRESTFSIFFYLIQYTHKLLIQELQPPFYR